MVAALKAPFPYFGGKSRIADEVWRRLGHTRQYIEPFLGSAAVLLNKPRPSSLEVVCDANGYLANFWRCVKFQPNEAWAWADYPVSHMDLGARHLWLTEPERVKALEAKLIDPDWPGDPKLAGWWLWGQCCWIGSGWCDWFRAGQIPHASDAGRGVQAPGQIPHAGNAGRGWLLRLSSRLARVRVVHGNWDRCLNHHYGNDDTAVFLDPPYKAFEKLYGSEPIAAAAEDWARDNANLRVAICGHVGDYELPGWSVLRWSRGRLTYSGGKTTDDEAIWFSPSCANGPSGQASLFGGPEDDEEEKA